MSRRLPRERRKLSRTAICSRLRCPKRPTLKSPSRVVPQVLQWRRVTESSPEQTGQVAMTSCGMWSSWLPRSCGPCYGTRTFTLSSHDFEKRKRRRPSRGRGSGGRGSRSHDLGQGRLVDERVEHRAREEEAEHQVGGDPIDRVAVDMSMGP